MKTYTVWLREECHNEYRVRAENAEDAKKKVKNCTFDLDGYGHLVNTYYEPWGNGDEIFDVEDISDDLIVYPFSDGDTYYTLDGDEWVESTWDSVSEEIHDDNPNKEYYREPNKESKVNG